jgi:hypothetical protein
MKEYNIKYELKGTGYLTFSADNAEEAEEEFYRIMCGDRPQIEENDWIDSDVIYDVEYDCEILKTKEE